MQKTRVTVQVAGQTMHLCGTEDETHIRSIATYVDNNIRSVEEKHPALSTNTCILLGALNIAEELFKLRQQYEELDRRIEELRELSAPQPLPRREAKNPVKHPFEEKVTVLK